VLFRSPLCTGYMFPSHVSHERGYEIAAGELKLDPWLMLDMRLGEGSGCPLAFMIADASCAVMNNMVTFDGGGINDEYLDEIRDKDEWDG